VLYCPSCRGEYQDWVITCPDCGAGTVTALPELPPPEPEPEPIEVVALDLRHLSPSKLEALRWRLEVEGATVVWVDASTLEVAEPDAAAIEAFITEIEAEGDDDPPRRPTTLGDHVVGVALQRGRFIGRLLAWLKTR
jgi:hypothetical protein